MFVSLGAGGGLNRSNRPLFEGQTSPISEENIRHVTPPFFVVTQGIGRRPGFTASTFQPLRIAALLEVSGWSSAVSQFIAILAADATITGIDGQRHGIIHHWLQPIRDVAEANCDELLKIGDGEKKLNRLRELTVASQVASLSQTPILRSARKRGRPLTIHGWIYGLKDGLLRDLKCSCDSSSAAFRCEESFAPPDVPVGSPGQTS